MFRSFFALSLAFFLGSFASAYADQNSCSASSCKCRDGRDGRDGKPGRDGRDGKDADKCLSPPPPHGAIKFGDTANKCTKSTAGTVRYSTSQNTLELCDGNVWSQLVTAGKGQVADKPGRHCLDILNSGQSRGNGLYFIDPNGGSTHDSFQAFCDMETEGGGWTLVATKVSTNFLFIITTFSASAAKTTNADAASHIHPDMGDWEEVLFRFADDNNIRLIYNRKAGAPQSEKTEFENYLMGTSFQLIRNVHGFYKYSPADQNKRNPASGFATISQLHFYSDRGISEAHVGSDKWIDMWIGAENSNNYVASDNNAALGTKCIAGYCYLNKPIWVMVR